MSDNNPAIVRAHVAINFTIWERHGERLEKLQHECPDIPLSGRQGASSPRAREHKWRDPWGCLWHFPGMGLDGAVIEHPLADWDRIDDWQPPSPEPVIAGLREKADPPRAVGLEHGFLFLRLTYLRRFDNCMVDIAADDERLYRLRDMVADYWRTIIQAHLQAGSQHIHGGDDLGLQERLPMRPEAWRKLIKPVYRQLFALARERGGEVHLHTDGYIVDIIPDLIEVGVTTLNPQDLVNGLDNLARLAKGKVNIHLDIDRQKITVFGAADEIDAHIERCIRILGSPEGGLSLVWGVYPGTPIENIEAGVRAMQKHRDIWAR